MVMPKLKQTIKYSAILLACIVLPIPTFADITTLTEPSLDDDIDKKTSFT